MEDQSHGSGDTTELTERRAPIDDQPVALATAQATGALPDADRRHDPAPDISPVADAGASLDEPIHDDPVADESVGSILDEPVKAAAELIEIVGVEKARAFSGALVDALGTDKPAAIPEPEHATAREFPRDKVRRVRATEPGYHGKRRETGEEFEVPAGEPIGSWMEVVGVVE